MTDWVNNHPSKLIGQLIFTLPNKSALWADSRLCTRTYHIAVEEQRAFFCLDSVCRRQLMLYFADLHTKVKAETDVLISRAIAGGFVDLMVLPKIKDVATAAAGKKAVAKIKEACAPYEKTLNLELTFRMVAAAFDSVHPETLEQGLDHGIPWPQWTAAYVSQLLRQLCSGNGDKLFELILACAKIED